MDSQLTHHAGALCFEVESFPWQLSKCQCCPLSQKFLLLDSHQAGARALGKKTMNQSDVPYVELCSLSAVWLSDGGKLQSDKQANDMKKSPDCEKVLNPFSTPIGFCKATVVSIASL